MLAGPQLEVVTCAGQECFWQVEALALADDEGDVLYDPILPPQPGGDDPAAEVKAWYHLQRFLGRYTELGFAGFDEPAIAIVGVDFDWFGILAGATAVEWMEVPSSDEEVLDPETGQPVDYGRLPAPLQLRVDVPVGVTEVRFRLEQYFDDESDPVIPLSSLDAHLRWDEPVECIPSGESLTVILEALMTMDCGDPAAPNPAGQMGVLSGQAGGSRAARRRVGGLMGPPGSPG